MNSIGEWLRAWFVVFIVIANSWVSIDGTWKLKQRAFQKCVFEEHIAAASSRKISARPKREARCQQKQIQLSRHGMPLPLN